MKFGVNDCWNHAFVYTYGTCSYLWPNFLLILICPSGNASFSGLLKECTSWAGLSNRRSAFAQEFEDKDYYFHENFSRLIPCIISISCTGLVYGYYSACCAHNITTASLILYWPFASRDLLESAWSKNPSIENLTGLMLRLLGTHYNIEPCFFRPPSDGFLPIKFGTRSKRSIIWSFRLWTKELRVLDITITLLVFIRTIQNPTPYFQSQPLLTQQVELSDYSMHPPGSNDRYVVVSTFTLLLVVFQDFNELSH
jgi:hypothetical protein